jgi:hypothetical protein
MVASVSKAISRPDPYLRWGVVDGPWLWPTRIRVLFVVDGRISTDRCPGCFGLGLVLDTLRDASFAWWVQFEVSVVRRDSGQNRQCKTEVLSSQDINFRFTKPGFDLHDYDQVWFFGDYPANNYTAPITDPDFSPLSDPELKILAEWMDRGGGVFAAGDHFNLGASMCSRIPRVRTMRKWTVEQGVPPMDGPFRHQTLQPTTGTSDAWEGDSLPQPIEPVYQRSATSVIARSLIPHPLLCAPSGVIDKFPDHMHEGQVIDDEAVELDLPLDIAGYDGVEYPFEALPATEALTTVAPGLRPRPRPHVIAYGRTTQMVGPVAPQGPVKEAFAFNPVTESSPTGWRFGLVGAYDGDAARIGRVVVDSTWHHWFSYNLHGFVDGNPPMYELMQAYYRNVGLWLATPSQRRSMLVAATWGVVVGDPMAFPLEPRRSLWAVGERALDVICRTATQCTLFEFVKAFIDPSAAEPFRVPNHVEPSEPYSEFLPEDLGSRAIVGGIATALLEQSSVYHRAGGEERRLLDPEAIVRRALEGAQHGHSALVEVVNSSATSAARMATQLSGRSLPLSAESIPISVKLLRLRVVAERIQLTDPADPALVDGRFKLTVRFSIGGTLVADEVIDEIDVPTFDARGAFVDLSRVLFEGVIQSGERGVLELLTSRAGGAANGGDQLRFRETLTGEPSAWIGIHGTTASQSWRLWYRIEHANIGRQTD